MFFLKIRSIFTQGFVNNPISQKNKKTDIDILTKFALGLRSIKTS